MKLVGSSVLEQESTLFAVSLVAAVCGRNAVFQHLFTQEFSLAGEGAQAYSRHEAPGSLGKPEVAGKQLAKVARASERIAILPEFDRNKVLLSLRWYQMGFGGLGAEKFLMYWIALEALCMKKRTNIQPIREMLSSAYQMLLEDIEKNFRIGRLFEIRGRIVHKGEFIPLHFTYLRYMEALYRDLLFQRLGLPCERRAEFILSSCKKDLAILFPDAG
jgi:hypothetical protein